MKKIVLFLCLCASPLSSYANSLPPAPPVDAQKGVSEKVIFPRAQGLVLLGNDYRQLVGKQLKEAEPFAVVGLDVPGGAEGLKQRLLPLYLDRPLTDQDVIEIKKEIIAYYRYHGRPVVIVEVPNQNISQGILYLVVTESALGEIISKGNRWFKSKRLISYIHLKPDQPIDETVLFNDLQWINQNPFRRTDAIYTPGKILGTTDIELVTKDRFPLRLYAGADNTGLKDIGVNRWFAGMNWGNAFGLDHILSYQYTASIGSFKFQAHTVQYQAPLSWRHTLLLYGGYSSVHTHLNRMTRSQGNSYQASLRYEIPLRPTPSFLHKFVWGADFKRTNNTVEFVEFPRFGKNANLTQAVLGYSLGYETRKTKTSFETEIFGSPAEWVADQTKNDYQSLRRFATPKYAYGKLLLMEIVDLPKQFTYSLLMRGQFSSANLLPSEQFGLGGYDTVRGYEERIVNGDDAFLLNTEIRTPSVSLFPPKVHDSLIFLAFFDYGIAHNHKLLHGEPYSRYLMGIGPGMRYRIDPYLFVRVDWGIQLHHIKFDHHWSRVHFSTVLSF